MQRRNFCCRFKTYAAMMPTSLRAKEVKIYPKLVSSGGECLLTSVKEVICLFYKKFNRILKSYFKG